MASPGSLIFSCKESLHFLHQSACLITHHTRICFPQGCELLEDRSYFLPHLVLLSVLHECLTHGRAQGNAAHRKKERFDSVTERMNEVLLEEAAGTGGEKVEERQMGREAWDTGSGSGACRFHLGLPWICAAPCSVPDSAVLCRLLAGCWYLFGEAFLVVTRPRCSNSGVW